MVVVLDKIVISIMSVRRATVDAGYMKTYTKDAHHGHNQ